MRVLAIVLALTLVACGGDGPSVEDATEAQYQQWFAGQHGRLWETLHPDQQDQLERDMFLTCASENTDTFPTDARVEVTDTYDERITIPGTDHEVDSKAVTVALAAGEFTAQNTTHYVLVDDEWRWMLADLSEYMNC